MYCEDAITETYTDTERLIYKTIHQFVRRYGGNVEELKEYVGLCFVRAYRSYDRDKAAFSTWLRWRVWTYLMELYRQRARESSRLTFMDLDPDAHTAPRMFNRLAFVDNLSEDARLVVELALDTPWQSQPSPQAIRGCLWAYLRQPAIGWQAARIRQSFREVRLALAALP